MDGPGSTTVAVTILDDQTIAVDVEAIRSVVAATAIGEGAVGEITVTLVDLDAIEALNREHMNAEGPTDVLSFPVDGLVRAATDVPVMVGDLVICPAYAAQSGQELADELKLLAVHGTLHLLGFDHDTDENAQLMRDREIRFAGRAGAEA